MWRIKYLWQQLEPVIVGTGGDHKKRIKKGRGLFVLLLLYLCGCIVNLEEESRGRSQRVKRWRTA